MFFCLIHSETVLPKNYVIGVSGASTTLVILVAKSERRVINYFLAVVRWSPAVPWSPTCQNLKMIDGPRCLLKAINVSRFY